jgi:hypothetical protein
MKAEQEPTSQRRRCAEHFICADYGPALSCYDERITTARCAALRIFCAPSTRVNVELLTTEWR